MIVSKQRRNPSQRTVTLGPSRFMLCIHFFCRISAGASFYPCLLVFPKERPLGFPSHRGSGTFWSRTDYSPVKKITLQAGYKKGKCLCSSLIKLHLYLEFF